MSKPGNRIVRLTEETWLRLQSHATEFSSSELGTPEKVIAMLLDYYEDNQPPPDEPAGDAA